VARHFAFGQHLNRFAFGQRLNRFEDLIQSEFLDEGGVRFGCDSRRDAVPAAGLRFLGAWEMRFRGVDFCVEFDDVLGEVGLTPDRATLCLQFS
jgi:hypothetical protein